jgi:hypothetical protein
MSSHDENDSNRTRQITPIPPVMLRIRVRNDMRDSSLSPGYLKYLTLRAGKGQTDDADLSTDRENVTPKGRKRDRENVMSG